jgi:hypothetical protein
VRVRGWGYWIYLAEDKIEWRTVVEMVKTFLALHKAEKVLCKAEKLYQHLRVEEE